MKKFDTEDQHTIQNVVARTTWLLVFVQPWHKTHNITFYSCEYSVLGEMCVCVCVCVYVCEIHKVRGKQRKHTLSFIIYSLRQILLGLSNTGDKMDPALARIYVRNLYTFGAAKFWGNSTSKIVELKCISKKWLEKLWSSVMWFRIGTDGEPL
jgi:hypothetical protein